MNTATDMRTTDVSPLVRRRLEKLEADVDELKDLVASLLTGNDRTAVDARQGQRPSPAAQDPAPTAVPGKPLPGEEGLDAARSRGEIAKVRWVQDGDVVPTQALATAWGLTPQALGAAIARGEIFAIKVGNKRYFPREFLQLERDAVAAVCHALGELTPAEKLVFWTRAHGALGGRALTASMTSGVPLGRLVQLARAWADERGAAHGTETA